MPNRREIHTPYIAKDYSLWERDNEIERRVRAACADVARDILVTIAQEYPAYKASRGGNGVAVFFARKHGQGIMKNIGAIDIRDLLTCAQDEALEEALRSALSTSDTQMYLDPQPMHYSKDQPYVQTKPLYPQKLLSNQQLRELGVPFEVGKDGQAVIAERFRVLSPPNRQRRRISIIAEPKAHPTTQLGADFHSGEADAGHLAEPKQATLVNEPRTAGSSRDIDAEIRTDRIVPGEPDADPPNASQEPDFAEDMIVEVPRQKGDAATRLIMNAGFSNIWGSQGADVLTAHAIVNQPILDTTLSVPEILDIGRRAKAEHRGAIQELYRVLRNFRPDSSDIPFKILTEDGVLIVLIKSEERKSH